MNGLKVLSTQLSTMASVSHPLQPSTPSSPTPSLSQSAVHLSGLPLSGALTRATLSLTSVTHSSEHCSLPSEGSTAAEEDPQQSARWYNHQKFFRTKFTMWKFHKQTLSRNANFIQGKMPVQKFYRPDIWKLCFPQVHARTTYISCLLNTVNYARFLLWH